MSTAQARNTAIATYNYLLATGHREYVAMKAGEISCNSVDSLESNLLLSEECPNYKGHWDNIAVFDPSPTGIWYGSLEGVGA